MRELTPLGSGSSLVTETYDCSHAPGWLQQRPRGGTRWIDNAAKTLEKLDAMSRG